jgi:branched-chain amino acid transport system ATP-binding protein
MTLRTTPSATSRHDEGLIVRNLCVGYGQVVAIDGLDLDLPLGSVLGVLGPNGAGKSSLVKALSGIAPCRADAVSIGGVSLIGLRPEQRAALLAHVPEGRHLFPDHTVRENLMVAAFDTSRHERRTRLTAVESLLPQLAEHADRLAGALSGGQQQMVAIGRGLMSGAPILAVDELSLGLAPIVATQLGHALRRLADTGVGVLLVEQYVSLVLAHADAVIVLDRGRVAFSGRPSEIEERLTELQSTYLGTQ